MVVGGKIDSLGRRRFIIFRFLENDFGVRSLGLVFLGRAEMSGG